VRNRPTANLTAFFREGHHFVALADDLAARRGRPLRIWRNAASTGEEPYSIATTAAETLGDDAPVKILAKRLDGLARIRVSEAVDGERVLPGHAHLAPGGLHLSVERSAANYVARVRDGETVNRHKPSVEVLFESASRRRTERLRHHADRHGRADGALAMRAMREAGAYKLAQVEASCVVFGMPREAIVRGARSEKCCRWHRSRLHLLERLRTTSGLSINRL